VYRPLHSRKLPDCCARPNDVMCHNRLRIAVPQSPIKASYHTDRLCSLWGHELPGGPLRSGLYPVKLPLENSHGGSHAYCDRCRYPRQCSRP
jgi:hypothetical protein